METQRFTDEYGRIVFGDFKTGEDAWIRRTQSGQAGELMVNILADLLLARFADPAQGGFFSTADDHEVVDVKGRQERPAETLGYRPNPIARGLRTNRSHTIGVLVPDLMNPLFAAVVGSILAGVDDPLPTFRGFAPSALLGAPLAAASPSGPWSGSR